MMLSLLLDQKMEGQKMKIELEKGVNADIQKLEVGEGGTFAVAYVDPRDKTLCFSIKKDVIFSFTVDEVRQILLKMEG